LSDYLAAKFGPFSSFSDLDARILREAGAGRVRRLQSGETLIHEGQRPESVHLIVDGWAYRCNVGADGQRVITGLFLPGDLCDMSVYLLAQMDHSIIALTPVTLIEIDRRNCDRMTASPAILRAILRDQLVGASIMRRWLVGMGQRDALPRLAHLMCEIFVRQRGIRAGQTTTCSMPLRQQELAEVLGMSAIHVNRMLTRLRDDGLIELKQKTLTIPDFAALVATCDFSHDYLHIESPALAMA
jgi:CRP-like cAMP-binding protein